MLLPLAPRPAAVVAASLVGLAALLVAACGSEEPTPECLVPQDGSLVPADCAVDEGPPPDDGPDEPVEPERPTPTTLPLGAKLFEDSGCGGCHAIDGLSGGALGPDLTQIGSTADAAAYIRQSILEPDAAIAEACPSGACPPGVMPQNFGDRLTAEELDALVDFLVAQR